MRGHIVIPGQKQLKYNFFFYLRRKSIVGLTDIGYIWVRTTLEVVNGIVNQEARKKR